MKIQKQLKTRKVLATIIAAAIVLIGGATVLAYTTNSFPFNGTEARTTEEKEPKENDVNLDPSSDEQKDAGLDSKKDFVDKSYDDESAEASKGSSTIAITSIGGSADKTSVRTVVSPVTAAGTCTLTATGPGPLVTMSAGVQRQGSYSTCMGFDVTLSKGKWSITVEYTDQTGAITKDTQDYEVK